MLGFPACLRVGRRHSRPDATKRAPSRAPESTLGLVRGQARLRAGGQLPGGFRRGGLAVAAPGMGAPRDVGAPGSAGAAGTAPSLHAPGTT